MKRQWTWGGYFQIVAIERYLLYPSDSHLDPRLVEEAAAVPTGSQPTPTAALLCSSGTCDYRA